MSSGGVPIVLNKGDLAELAARIGSKNVYDRGGNVIFYDDFSNGLEAWALSDTNISWSAARSLGGGFSCMVNRPAGAGGSNILRYDTMTWQQPNVGIEYSFSWSDIIYYTRLFFANGQGGTRYAAEVRIALNEILIYASGGVTYSIPNPGFFNQWTGLWNYIKLYVDFQTRRYIKLRANNLEFDLSGYRLRESQTTVTQPFTMTQISGENPTGNTGQIYFGHVIETTEEVL